MTESVFTIQEEETNRKLSFDQNGRTEYTVEFNGKDHGVLPLKMLKHLKEDMWWYENDLARKRRSHGRQNQCSFIDDAFRYQRP